MDGAKYLEIGVWKGSSTCSAMYGNKARVVAMDNFSSFGGPRDEFMENFAKHKGDNDADFIDHDCFSFDVEDFGEDSFNIFLADSDHSEESQRRIITDYVPVMQETFILIVDDWNWLDVRNGTQKGIEEAGLSVVWAHFVRTTHDNTFPDQEVAKNGFWNGIAVFILKKTK